MLIVEYTFAEELLPITTVFANDNIIMLAWMQKSLSLCTQGESLQGVLSYNIWNSMC